MTIHPTFGGGVIITLSQPMRVGESRITAFTLNRIDTLALHRALKLFERPERFYETVTTSDTAKRGE